MLQKFKEKVEKKIDLINELIISKLEIYFDNLGPGLDEIDAKIDATADDALNYICSIMGIKNTKRLKKDKKEKLLDRVCDLLKYIIREIHNEAGDIYITMRNVNVLDKNKLHLINDKLKEITTQTKKKLNKN